MEEVVALKELANRRLRRGRRVALFAVLPLALFALAGSTSGSAAGVSFSSVYVDSARGGGEGYAIYSHANGNLVVTTHEGTTLTKSGNIPGQSCDINTGTGPGPGPGPDGYLCSYNNHVNTWYSTDQGQTWTFSTQNPANTGFSDPSITEDECAGTACYLYNTGIDLANDALFASADGGVTWIAGTPQCPVDGGDRPWLAGGKHGEVFLATNDNVMGHRIWHGTVTEAPPGNPVALTCATTGIADSGGVGQNYYNHHNGELIEPKLSGGKIGIGVLPNAHAFVGPFVDRASTGPSYGSIKAHWPAIAISTDSDATHPAGTIYAVWDTDPSGPAPSGVGQNAILLTYTTDDGLTWSAPYTVASTGGTMQWPWIAAGANGNVSVIWYQADQLTRSDNDSGAAGSHPTNWSLQVANLYNVTSGSPTVQQVNAVTNFDGKHPNGTIHVGGICEGGTTCAATGQDRRIGDFVTNAIDQNGCVMIETGDTQQVNPITGLDLPNSLPLFVHQNSGPSLTTGLDCAAALAPDVPEAGTLIGLLATGATGALLVTMARRRRARSALA